LASSTVQETLAKLGEIFRTNVGYNPTYVPGSEHIHPELSRQFNGMRNADPGEVQQKALPVCVYKELHRLANSQTGSNSDVDRSVADIMILAFFFCMRSCEYSEVQGERRTKCLCVRNLRFYNINNQEISQQINELVTAETISITFEFQKRETRNDTISHQRVKGREEIRFMCPVRAAASIVQRLASYGLPPEKFEDTQLNFVRSGRGFYHISSTIFLQRIRFVVDCMGPERLGFTANKVGTHSNRSGGATGMFLAGTPIYTIMLMGRWSSDAFMRYIRKQVLQLSHGISTKMLTYNEFYTVPDFIHSNADNRQNYRGGVTLATTNQANGPHANMSRGLHPAFHLNH
jgi:hypothetical protein